MMRAVELAKEAQQCRSLAPQFTGRAEQPVLLKLACAFEQLAREGVTRK